MNDFKDFSLIDLSDLEGTDLGLLKYDGCGFTSGRCDDGCGCGAFNGRCGAKGHTHGSEGGSTKPQ